MGIIKSFGETVRQIRVSKNISQEDLALRAGLHRTYISSVERGKRNLSLENIKKIAVALEISIHSIFEIIESEEKN